MIGRNFVRLFLLMRNILKDKRKLYSGITLALLAGTSGGWWLHHRMTHVEEIDARVEGEMTTVASRVDGWVVARPVIDGDHVTKGQVLIELDKRDAQWRLKILEGHVAAQSAQIRETAAERDMVRKTSDAQIANAQAALLAAKEEVAGAVAKEKLARADFKRADTLINKEAVSRQSWDSAQSLLAQTEANLRQASKNVAGREASLAQSLAQRDEVKKLEHQLAVLDGELAALKAQAEQIRQEIADRTLRSPVNGVVDRTFINAGDYAQPGQWLVMVHDPDAIWVEARVKETEIGRIRLGQAVRLDVDAYPDLKPTGRVFRIGKAATSQFALLPSPNPSGNFTKITQRVPVRIALDRKAPMLQPGVMVEVSIDVAH